MFLCHNSEDKPAVREISRKWQRRILRQWLDEEETRPGTSWQIALGRQIESIKSGAVFVVGLVPGRIKRFRLFSASS
jgi:hypothetical protein